MEKHLLLSVKKIYFPDSYDSFLSTDSKNIWLYKLLFQIWGHKIAYVPLIPKIYGFCNLFF